MIESILIHSVKLEVQYHFFGYNKQER